MKIQSFIFALATAALTTTAFAKQPTVTTDRFKGTTKLETELQQVRTRTDSEGAYTSSIYLSANLKDGQPVGATTLLFLFGRTGWHYLNCHDVAFLVDGKPFEITNKFQSQMSRGAAIEGVEVMPTREQLSQLGAATKVEYRICRDEFALEPTMIQDIRDFGPAFDQALKGAAPATDAKGS